jgi:hypothetical protein
MTLDIYKDFAELEEQREWSRRPVPSADFIYTITDHQRAAQYAARLRKTMRVMRCPDPLPMPTLGVRARWLRGTDEDNAWLRAEGYA